MDTTLIIIEDRCYITWRKHSKEMYDICNQLPDTTVQKVYSEPRLASFTSGLRGRSSVSIALKHITNALVNPSFQELYSVSYSASASLL